EHAQELQAQQLKVWLEPSKEGKPPPGSDPQRPQPQHVDALGQVKAVAPNMRVHDTDHLILWFKDVAPTATPLAATPPVREASPAEKTGDSPAHQEPSSPAGSSDTTPSVAAPGPAGASTVTAAKPPEQTGTLPSRARQAAPTPTATGAASANAPANPDKPK